MRIKEITTETTINEISLIPDFDDEINAARKFGRWESEMKTAKTIGKIDNMAIKAVAAPEYHATIYFIMDGKTPVGRASLTDTPRGYKRVKHIWLNPDYRGKGYGVRLYGFWIDKGMTIISDYDQTRFSKALWARLAKQYVVRPIDLADGIGEPVTDIEPFYGTHEMLLASKT